MKFVIGAGKELFTQSKYGQDETDERLALMAAKGSKKAYSVLIGRYYQKIYASILLELKDEGYARDLAQEVLIKIYRYMGCFKHRSSFATWLYTITRNTIKNYYRSQHLEYELSEALSEVLASEEPTPENCLIGFELNERIEHTFAELPSNWKHCYIMYVEGNNYQTIAKKMACPIGTVRSRINRVKTLLKAAVL